MKNSKEKTVNNTKTRVILDLLFFIAMILVLIPQSTGIPIHEWLSFIILIPFFLHLLINWAWIVNHSKNLFQKQAQKSKFDYIFNWILYLFMLVATVSGIVISESALVSLGIHFEINPFWTTIHNASASLFIAVLGIHLALHWKWIVKAIKKLHLKSDLKYLNNIGKILKNRKKEIIALLSISIILSLGIWFVEFTDWAQNISINNSSNTNSESENPPMGWLIYILPLIKVSVFLIIPGLLTRLVIKIISKFKK